MKKLAIAIPTYNRAEKVKAQLQFLLKECEIFTDKIDIYVFDNCSTDNTTEVIQEVKNHESSFQYHRNSTNLGLVGNCLHIINTIQNEYVWLVGDDDKLKLGIVQEIYEHLDTKVGLIHLNHTCINGVDGSVVHSRFYDGNFDGLSSKNLINALLKSRHAGGFMFITANILNTKLAREILSQTSIEEKMQLAYPMYLNLSLALQYGMIFINNPLLNCIYFTTSWAKEAYIVNEIQVPAFLIKLAKKGLSKSIISKILAHQTSFKINPLKFPLWVSLNQLKAVYHFLRT